MTVAAIALLGTSADPPTRGHQVLLEGLLRRYGQVATWASDNPLKQHDAPSPCGRCCSTSWWSNCRMNAWN